MPPSYSMMLPGRMSTPLIFMSLPVGKSEACASSDSGPARQGRAARRLPRRSLKVKASAPNHFTLAPPPAAVRNGRRSESIGIAAGEQINSNIASGRNTAAAFADMFGGAE
jgi:hypothetical protein